MQTTKISQGQKIIRALRESKEGITSRDMINLGIFKYSSRIAELRHDGWNVVAVHEKGSLWRYHLVEDDEN
jgi:hypothetical protein